MQTRTQRNSQAAEVVEVDEVVEVVPEPPDLVAVVEETVVEEEWASRPWQLSACRLAGDLEVVSTCRVTWSS
mgnify:CR=1 FL=1